MGLSTAENLGLREERLKESDVVRAVAEVGPLGSMSPCSLAYQKISNAIFKPPAPRLREFLCSKLWDYMR